MGRRWIVGGVAGKTKRQEDVLLFGSDEGSVLYNRVIVKRAADIILTVVLVEAPHSCSFYSLADIAVTWGKNIVLVDGHDVLAVHFLETLNPGVSRRCNLHQIMETKVFHSHCLFVR